MVNYLFLVIIFLFMAIEGVCCYKYFRFKNIKLGIFSLIYFLTTLVLTLSYFSIRNILIEDELTSLINGLKEINLFAIIILILNISMIVVSTISYVNIIRLERTKKDEK